MHSMRKMNSQSKFLFETSGKTFVNRDCLSFSFCGMVGIIQNYQMENVTDVIYFSVWRYLDIRRSKRHEEKVVFLLYFVHNN